MSRQKQPIAGATYYVVQPFGAVKGKRGGIAPEAPMAARDHDHALRIVERLRHSRAGVLAFRRTGSPETGDWHDAVIIARHGVVPCDYDDVLDESDVDAA